MALFYQELGPCKTGKIRLVMMDMWKAFRNSAARNAPQASILYDKFHVMRHLGEALDQVRKNEYARLGGHDRVYKAAPPFRPLGRRSGRIPAEPYPPPR